MFQNRLVAVIALILILAWSSLAHASDGIAENMNNLTHSDWRMRRDAVRAIGDTGRIDLLPYLEAALHDEDSNVRWAAIDALVAIGKPGVPLLIKAIDHPDGKVGGWAVEGLGKIGGDADEAVQRLIDLLEIDNPLMLNAINTLGAIGSNAKAAIPHLALLLAEDFRTVVAAKRAISQIDPNADLVGVLLEILETGGAEVSSKVAAALGSLGGQAQAAIPVLTDMLKEQDPHLREVAARTLGSLGSAAKNTVVFLVELLEDPVEGVRLACVDALGAIKAEPDVTLTALVKILPGANSDLKRAALRAVRSFGADAKPAVPYVALLAGDEDLVIRRMAQELLLEIVPSENAATLLAELINDPDSTLRMQAARALGYAESGHEQAVNLLRSALNDETAEVKAAAALALGNLEQYARVAADDLVLVAQDPDMHVSWAAVISLGRIAPETVADLVAALGADHVPLLIEAVVSGDDNTSKAAVAILKETAGRIGLVESMTLALQDGDDQMRSRAVKVLHAVGPDVEGVMGALVMALEDKNAVVASEARLALLELTGEKSILPVIANAMSHDDLRVRAAAQRLAQKQKPIYAELKHDTMTMAVGYPAVVYDDEQLPQLHISALQDGQLQVLVIVDQEQVVEEIALTMEAGAKITVDLSQKKTLGTHKLLIKFASGINAPYYDAFYFTVQDRSKVPVNSSKVAYLNEADRLVYVPDYKGNRLPDFSGVGYMGGGVPLPEVPVKIEVEPGTGDDTERIQAAIDYVSQLEPDTYGIRGAVLLKAGVYEIGSNLKINASGVVLRGEGQGDTGKLWLDPAKRWSLAELKAELKDEQATILVATGSSMRKVLQVGGGASISIDEASASRILDEYVPVGANCFYIEHPERFSVGDSIVVRRFGNAEWISEIGMDRIPPRSDGAEIVQWSPFHLDFQYVIVGIDGNKVTIDSSIVNAIESQWGGGLVLHYTDRSRISQVGVENLRAISFWIPNQDGVDDTRHADTFLDLFNIKHSWIKNVTLEHFTSTDGAIRVGRGSAWITVQDSSVLVADRRYYEGPGYDPSGRTYYETNVYVGRYGFHLQGQSILVMRCFALNNRHGFTFGSRVSGPNVFLDCTGEQALTWSEPHHRWSTGGLYDNVNDLIALMNRSNMGSGHGWAGANYVAWNTVGTLVAHRPPTAQNWAIGHVGRKDSGGNRGPDGFWDSHGRHVEPRSLYLQQLNDRLGEEALRNIGY